GDVHGAPADEIFHPAHQLLRAGRVVAIDADLAGHASRRRVADRAALRRADRLLTAVAGFNHGTDHVGDDVSGALDDNPVADANIFPGDLVEVVQGGVAHDDAANLHRLQHGV